MTDTLSRTGKFAVLASAVLTTALTSGMATSTAPANAAGAAAQPSRHAKAQIADL